MRWQKKAFPLAGSQEAFDEPKTKKEKNNKNNSVASVIRNDKFEMSAVAAKCHCLCEDVRSKLWPE